MPPETEEPLLPLVAMLLIFRGSEFSADIEKSGQFYKMIIF
jgi:hypothetical protein